MRRAAWVVATLVGVVACREGGAGLADAKEKGKPEAPAPGSPAREVVARFRSAMGVDATFRLEIADRPVDRARGLMYRKSLAPDRGMVFVFPAEEVQNFYMKNTYVPLDMVFVSADGRVVGVVEDARPLTLDIRSVPAPSRYVVELNAFAARAQGIRAGTTVTFDPALPVVKE